MATFVYSAIDGEGRRVSGRLTSASREAALAELDAKSVMPLEVTESSSSGSEKGRRVPPRALARSYQQLGDMLRAGVPLLRSLELLAKQKSSKRLAATWQAIIAEVADGAELSGAFESRDRVFPPTHAAMIRAGERGGFLEKIFERLAETVEREAELKSKIGGAMIYPSVLASVGSVILGAIFTFFVPAFKGQFERRLDHLPFVTELVFGVSSLATTYGVWTLLTLIALSAGAWFALRRPGVAKAWSRFVLRIPVVGELVRSLAIARFCRLLGTMESNGVPLLEAMTIARGAAGNLVLADAIDEGIAAVREGGSLAEPLGANELFPDEVVEMVAVGETSGNLDTVLLGVAGSLEGKADRTLRTLVQLVEPAMLLVIGVTIATVAVGLILPLFELTA